MLGARRASAACSGVRTAGAAGAAAGGAEATGGGGTGTPRGALAVLGRSLATARVSGGAGASAAVGGVPSAPADGGLEGSRLSEGRSGTAPTWILAALLVTGRMMERSFRLTTDESRDQRRASPPSPVTTHNTATMATEDKPRFAFPRPGLRGSGGGVVSRALWSSPPDRTGGRSCLTGSGTGVAGLGGGASGTCGWDGVKSNAGPMCRARAVSTIISGETNRWPVQYAATRASRQSVLMSLGTPPE